MSPAVYPVHPVQPVLLACGVGLSPIHFNTAAANAAHQGETLCPLTNFAAGLCNSQWSGWLPAPWRRPLPLRR